MPENNNLLFMSIQFVCNNHIFFQYHKWEMRNYWSWRVIHASAPLRSVHPSGGYFILREQIVFLWPNTQREVKYESLLSMGPFVLLLCFNGGGGATIYWQWWQEEETESLELQKWILVSSVHWIWQNREWKEWIMILRERISRWTAGTPLSDWSLMETDRCITSHPKTTESSIHCPFLSLSPPNAP